MRNCIQRWCLGLGLVLADICLLVPMVIGAFYVCRMRANLLDRGCFVQSSKTQIGQNVFLYRTSGRDVMLADKEGWGLLDGNIQQYAAIGDTIYLAYVKCGENAVSFGAYETKDGTFLELTRNEIERRGICGQWRSVP